MRISPPVALPARRVPEPAGWELWLRYGAATASTLVAIAGAQLLIPNKFALALATIALMGVPVSLYLRRTNMRVGGVSIPRPLWNFITVLAAVLASSYYVFWSLHKIVMAFLMGTNVSQAFWLRFSAGDSVNLLMQSFLLFAAFRSFALISDKDATLTTVPSFSVLLLLIPVQRGLEVVIYFVLWTIVAATLFALDHRAESRAAAVAYVPSLTPGHEVRLSMRGLASVLGFSLASSVAISYYLTAHDPEQRTTAESAVTAIATRLTQFALSLPEMSVNAGPERQIDFNSSPTLPSRALLWKAMAVVPETHQFERTTYRRLHPEYWRMFTLGVYDGQSWSQDQGATLTLKRDPRAHKYFPRLRFRGNMWGHAWHSRHHHGANGGDEVDFDPGFKLPAARGGFGVSNQYAVEVLMAQQPQLGYVPIQPGARLLLLSNSSVDQIRARDDGAVDVGVMEPGDLLREFGNLPRGEEYGGSRQLPQPNPNSKIVLPALDRKRYLQLPRSLPPRVRNFAFNVLRTTRSGDSNLLRAQRLSLAIQQGAVYTLHPPALPSGHDAVDYFLFEGNRRGYCTYFASALAVCCRASGIPARIATGFVTVEWDSEGNALLREANTHAWTEIWQEGVGWKTVDATPSDDRGENSPTWVENWTDVLSSSYMWCLDEIRRESVPFMLACLVVAALALQGWRQLLKTGSWALWSEGKIDDDVAVRRQVGAWYGRAARILARSFRPRAAWETPREWLAAAKNASCLQDTEGLTTLTELYLLSTYAVAPLPPGAAPAAREAWKSLNWKRARAT